MSYKYSVIKYTDKCNILHLFYQEEKLIARVRITFKRIEWILIILSFVF